MVSAFLPLDSTYSGMELLYIFKCLAQNNKGYNIIAKTMNIHPMLWLHKYRLHQQ